MGERSKGLDYVRAHEEFMQHHNGTSIWENFFLITPAPIYAFLTCFVMSFLQLFSISSIYRRFWIFSLEFSGYILPTVLNVTLLNHYSFEMFIISLTLFTSIVLFIYFNSYEDLSAEKRLLQLQLKPFLSYFRAIVNVLTVICILAVDFKIFPRRLAKTENYGYGLMDTGVGFFVVVNAAVCKPGNKRAFLNVLQDCALLLLLGALRVLSVSSIDYQSHVSEYGVHWNFFFTLAVVKLLGNFAASLSAAGCTILSVLIGVIHQLILSCGLEDWVSSDLSRTTSLIIANREGLISLPGYVALYIASLALSHYLHKLKSTSQRKLHLIYFSRLFALCLFFTLVSESIFNVSRKVANLTYILWIFTTSVYVIILCLCLELSLAMVYLYYRDSSTPYVPEILSSINFNGMPFFLFANALTGLINICFQTIYMSSFSSLVIITGYMLVISFASCSLFWHGIKIKL